MELECVIGCPKCEVPTAYIYRRQVAGREPGHYENVTEPIRVVQHGKTCPECGSVLERLKG